MRIKYLVSILSLVCLTIIETVALCKGVNGHTLAASIGGVTLIGGYAIGRITIKRKE